MTVALRDSRIIKYELNPRVLLIVTPRRARERRPSTLANLSIMFNQISDFNPGLDLAQLRYEAAGTYTDPVLTQFYGRSQMCTKKFVPDNKHEVYSPTIKVISRHT